MRGTKVKMLRKLWDSMNPEKKEVWKSSFRRFKRFYMYLKSKGQVLEKPNANSIS